MPCSDEDFANHIQNNYKNRYPLINLKTDKIQKLIDIIAPQNQKIQYNLDIVLLVIQSEIRGIRLQSPDSKELSFGEGILVDSQDIKSIKALQKVNDFTFANKMKKKLAYFKMDYVNVPTSEKKELPDWLNYQIVKGSIIFYGIPRFLDEGEIKIRIKNADDFVLKEFWINVQAPDEEDLENLEYLKN